MGEGAKGGMGEGSAGESRSQNSEVRIQKRVNTPAPSPLTRSRASPYPLASPSNTGARGEHRTSNIQRPTSKEWERKEHRTSNIQRPTSKERRKLIAVSRPDIGRGSCRMKPSSGDGGGFVRGVGKRGGRFIIRCRRRRCLIIWGLIRGGQNRGWRPANDLELMTWRMWGRRRRVLRAGRVMGVWGSGGWG